MQIIRRTFWYVIQIISVVYFFSLGGALSLWPFTATYEETKAKFGNGVPNTCNAFVVSGRSVSYKRPYYCHKIKNNFGGRDIETFILIWSFVGNIFILYSSGKPNRGFPHHIKNDT
jgi:phosphatidylserine synthase